MEIGCGTGKNTQWLLQKAKKVTAIDFSEEMLAKAKQKINLDQVQFIQADITEDWEFRNDLYDLVSFSLVLEHIDNLEYVFGQAALSLNNGGYVYIGELHPSKQYSGTKAQFETEAGLQVVECFNHHVSDFTQAARKQGLILVDLDEFFDDANKKNIPRILTIVLKKA